MHLDNSRRARLHLTKEVGGIIAVKTGRMQLHFFSDVLVAVASLDLKVFIVVFIKSKGI